MLTESFLLSRALQEAEIALEAQHPAIKTPGRSTGPVIRVCLDAGGAIIGCERIDGDNLAGLWSHFDGNHNSFPVIRLSEPLMHLPEGNSAAEPEAAKVKTRKVGGAERRAVLKSKLSRAQPRQLSSNTLNLFVRLRGKADDLAKTVGGQDEEIALVCNAYNSVVPPEATSNVTLLEALRQKAIECISVCEESELEAFEVLLLAASEKAGGKKAQIALDGPGARTIYRTEVRKKVTRAYLERNNDAEIEIMSQKASNSLRTCAYTGSKDLWTGPFPKVKLPDLGKEFYIFSMNSDAECNVRYHNLTDSQTAPIGKRVVLELQDALNYILAEDRKGKTWRRIASEKAGVFDQLIAYVDGQPSIPAAVADFFGRTEDTLQLRFDADASAVCEALEGIRREHPNSRLNLFILRKASEGQAFVVLAEAPTVQEVLSGADWWQLAAKNVPLGAPADKYVITFPVFADDKRLERLKPRAPSPGQVAALLTQGWLRNRGGSATQTRTRANKLRGAALSEVLDIMLQRPGKSGLAARRILSLCLKHAGPLLRDMGACRQRQNTENWKVYGNKERFAALTAVSTIGITLFALQSKKEDYMHESAFQIGQLLALADRLHRCYCTVVRDNAMPPTLIGNAVFDAALDNPEKAVAMLAERIRVYQGWAATVKPQGDGAKRIASLEAKKVLGLYKPLALKLYEQGFPKRCDDVTKAHILLGYLAGEENEVKTEAVDR